MKTLEVGMLMYFLTLIGPLGFIKLFWSVHWSLNLMGVFFLVFHTYLWIPFLRNLYREIAMEKEK